MMIEQDPVYVVMPAHNEGRAIARVISGIYDILPKARIIVVNDGSTDDTAAAAVVAGAKVVSLPFNCGYGVALLTGLTEAFRTGAALVVTIDADGQHEPRSIESVLKPIREGGADLVLGSRYLPNSVSYRVPRLRLAISRCLAWLLTAITGQQLTDTTTGFQCMNRKTLERFVSLKDFPEKSPDADLILYAVRSGCRVVEVPVTMREDQGGESMHGVFKSMFYVPKLFTAMLSVMLEYGTSQRRRA